MWLWPEARAQWNQNQLLGVLVVVQWIQIWLGTMRFRVWSLASLSGLRIYELWSCRRGLDLALLWLWCRPAAIAPIGPLAWECLECGLKNQKKKKKKEPVPGRVECRRSGVGTAFLSWPSPSLSGPEPSLQCVLQSSKWNRPSPANFLSKSIISLTLKQMTCRSLVIWIFMCIWLMSSPQGHRKVPGSD